MSRRRFRLCTGRLHCHLLLHPIPHEPRIRRSPLTGLVVRRVEQLLIGRLISSVLRGRAYSLLLSTGRRHGRRVKWRLRVNVLCGYKFIRRDRVQQLVLLSLALRLSRLVARAFRVTEEYGRTWRSLMQFVHLCLCLELYQYFIN